MKKLLLEIVYWSWCLPQTLLGLILKLIFKGEKYNNYYVYTYQGGSISLGKYVLITHYSKDNSRIVKHELGHQKQSFILGWLYLIVIGLPSLIWCHVIHSLVCKLKKKYVSYYSFYTEAWADKLGGVNVLQ